ncbi:MAG: superinfection immunity protein [Rhizobium sp.]|nr:superinfection immunity protein [Rhizobium sp.]
MEKFSKLLVGIGIWSIPLSVHAQSIANLPDEQRKSIITVVVVGLAIFLLPSWISLSRDHHNKGPIILVNLFLGFTVVGWLVALIWSVSAVKKNETVVIHSPAMVASAVPIAQTAPVVVPAANKTVAERIIDLKGMLDAGAISEAEFTLLKQDAMKRMG